MVARVLKILCVFFASVSVILCGCHKNTAEKGLIITDFSADFSAQYNGLSLSGRVVNTRQGVSSIDIESPETLKGMSLHYKSGEVELIRGDVKATADEAYLPQNSLPSMMYEIFKSIQSDEYSREGKDNVFSVRQESSAVTLTTDENNLPKTIEGEDYAINFSNAKKLGS